MDIKISIFKKETQTMIINKMKCPEHRHRNVYKICSILCGLPKNLICSKCLFFIGPMPVNLDRSSISDIYKKEHIILEKSDGIRYLLFGNNQNFSLIDRNKKSHNILKKSVGKNIDLSFLDGELTFNMILEKYNYLIYDIGLINGDWRISSWDLYSRSQAVSYYLLNLFERNKLVEIFLTEKLFFYKYNINKLLQAISINSYTKEHVFLNLGINGLFNCNKNDGLIFSQLRANYSLRTTCTTFKWKYEFENTMDLLIQKKIENYNSGKKSHKTFGLSSLLNKNKLLKIYESKKLNFSLKIKHSIPTKKKKIGEFRYFQYKGSWILKKRRFDKTKPNSHKVLCNTFKIISESINKFELTDNILKFQARKERGKCCEKY